MAKLAAEYGAEAPAELAAAIERLQKRLGGLATKQALAAVEARDFPLMVEPVLDYYDKTYTYGLAPQPGQPAPVLVPVAGCDAAANAAALLQVAQAAAAPTPG